MITSKVVADSIDKRGNRITTALITLPRIILSELNTHRMLSKNSASSRAIPFNKMIESVQTNPFIPIAWQKDHKGMQGTEYITDNYTISLCQDEWLKARDNTVESAEQLNGGYVQNDIKFGQVTKQLCNRLLEPFMWHTVLITGTDDGWRNFFDLRCPQYYHPLSNKVYKSKKDFIHFNFHPDNPNEKLYITPDNETEWLQINKGQAEIHMMALAECIWDSFNESKPRLLENGDWHIPFEDKIMMDLLTDIHSGKEVNDNISLIKVSTGMAARTSYTVVGDEKEIDYNTLLRVHDKCLEMKHSSVFEHCARAMNDDEYNGYIKGNIHDFVDRELQKDIKTKTGKTFITGEVTDKSLGWCRNYKGFIQYREFVENGLTI